jgi:hypothetical protein
MKIGLGGTAPGFWGAPGIPGARGRPGGKYFRKYFYLFTHFSSHLAPGRAGGPGNPGSPGYRGLPGDSVCLH